MVGMSGLIIIPAYNEEGAIGEFLRELLAEGPQQVHIVVVDDGSKDRTAAVVKAMGVACCRLPCNLGYTGALKTGLLYGLELGVDWFAFIDSDGQHRPCDLKNMVERYTSMGDCDLMVGSRWLDHKPDQSAAQGRRLGMEFFSWLTEKLTGHRFTDTTNGLKLMNAKVAKELVTRNFGDFHAETLIYLHDRGYRIAEHPIVVRARETGSSMYSFKDVVFYPLKNLILIAIFKLNSWTLAQVERK
jgi:glycosyltransferase involved in cell wall biosynthesis